MADNFAFTEGLGKTGAADEIGGVLYPRVKISHGSDGSATDVSTASPLPAQLRDSDGTDVALSTKLGSLTETAPATDTASSGLNGRLQRIAQRITSLIALIPAALSGSGNFKVAVQEALPAGTNNIGDVDIATIAAGDNNIGNVDVVTVPADPFGANADAAATAGGTGSMQAKLRLITSQLDSIKTAVETLDNTVGGSELQVDIVGALPAGNNNIGDVDVASIAAGDNNIGNVDLASAIPAGANLIGKVSASNETSTVYDGSTALTPKFAIVDAASSGDNTLVAAVNPKKIRVLAAYLVAAASVNVRFESGASGTALSGQMNLAANGGFVLPYNPVGWFETASNTLLNLELSGAVSVDGSIVYVEV